MTQLPTKEEIDYLIAWRKNGPVSRPEVEVPASLRRLTVWAGPDDCGQLMLSNVGQLAAERGHRLPQDAADRERRRAEAEAARKERDRAREAFMRDLVAIEEKHGVYVGGCGCCDSPHLSDDPPGDTGEIGDWRADLKVCAP